MKKVKTTILMMTALAVMFSVSSCSNEKKGEGHDHAAMEADKKSSSNDATSMTSVKVDFKDESMKEAFQNYIRIRTTLTNADAIETKIGGGMLVKSLSSVEGSEKATEAANTIAGTEDIEAQRLAFSNLSEEMLTMVKGNIASGELYLAHCPMAKDNAGANWISSTKEIMNPYFGDKMMKCGVIQETLN